MWCCELASQKDGFKVTVTFGASRDAKKGILVSTTDEEITGERSWVETPAELKRVDEGRDVSAALPEGATAWFVNLLSDRLTASPDFRSLE